MTQHENPPLRPEAYLAERLSWMQDAVEVMGAERTADPLEVFPEATEPRDAAEALPLDEDQETKLREVAGRFGIGGEMDIRINAEVQILEGGKPWKVDAEAAIAGDAQTVIFAGSPYRTIGKDESDYLKEKYGVDLGDHSEYDMVRFLAEQQEGYEPLEVPETQPFGYDISHNNQLVEQPTEQLIKIGTIDERPVMLLGVDRENYTDEEGQAKYRNQPDSAALMGFISLVLSAEGDETSAVGLNTSTTYPSRAVDTVRAGLAHGRFFDVGMYGRQTLADVRGQEVAEPTGMNQIPGELHAMHKKLLALQTEIEASA